jgi:DNA-binding MarR family transcriptional regulator
MTRGAVGKRRDDAEAELEAQQTEVDITPLMVMSRTINAVIVRSLADVDTTVTVPQLRVLVILSVHERLNLSGVADRLGVNASNASRTCDQLVRRGLVDRQEDPHDRRHLSLALARPGRRLLDDVMKRREVILAGVVATMKPQDQRDLMAALGKFNVAAEGLVSDTAPGHSPHLLARWPG